MNWKRLILAILASFVTMFVLDFVFHGILLKNLYQQSAALWRPMDQMMRLNWLMWLLYLVVSCVMTLIYSKGYELGKSGLGQGFRFGILFGLLMATSMSFGSYFMMPMPKRLALYWLVGGMIIYTIIGMVIGLIYKPESVS